jgi:hypothetical protein
MDISIRCLNSDPIADMREAALWTIGRELPEGELPEHIIGRYFKAEHSPIHSIHIRIYLRDIPRAVAMQLRTHSKHQEHYIQTSRPDITGKPRDPASTVNHIIDTNPRALIDMMRRRLCFKAEDATREVCEAIRLKLWDMGGWYKELARVLTRNCHYRGQCCELKPCGRVI